MKFFIQTLDVARTSCEFHLMSSRGTKAVSRSTAAATPSARVLELFEGHRLTPTQRRIAQCLVENAAEAAFMSSSELADLTNVSQPSVTRFAIALGYEGYPDLRRRLRELHLGEQAEDRQDARRNEFQHAVMSEIKNLEGLAAALSDPGPVVEAGRILAASRPLVVVGKRVAAPLAEYLGFFAAKVHPDVRVLSSTGSVSEDQLEQARDAGATAVLAVVLPRYPQESIKQLRQCRELGFTIVTITDLSINAATELSDIVLPAPVGTDLVFDSQATPMVLAVVLLQAMCDAIPKRAQERLEAFERSAESRELFIS
jgi:DNA-binding MurR/RpiR family transcriptional regulator